MLHGMAREGEEMFHEHIGVKLLRANKLSVERGLEVDLFIYLFTLSAEKTNTTPLIPTAAALLIKYVSC